MGDDLRQEERNSVRTPMQWTAEPNAGFADPSVKKLCRPVINSGKFDYRRVNVQAQRRDPGASSTRTDSRAACANAAGSRSGFAAALGHTAGHRLGNRTGCFGISQYHNPTARAGVLDRARKRATQDSLGRSPRNAEAFCIRRRTRSTGAIRYGIRKEANNSSKRVLVEIRSPTKCERDIQNHQSSF
jgi:hypothetical protein